MKKSFMELVDISKLQELTDEFYRTFSIPSSIVDLNGKILTRSGWQSVCLDFHRQHHEIEKDCIELEKKARNQLNDGVPYVINKCPQGLFDGATSIVIDGEIVANVIAGQVFLETPDEKTEQFFREQAGRFGFDEKKYMEAFNEIPVLSEDQFKSALSFLVKLVKMITELGLLRLREVESSEKISENEEKYQDLFENISDIYYRTDPEGIVTVASPSVEHLLGYLPGEIIGRNLAEFHLFKERRELFQSEIRKYGYVQNFDAQIKARDGSIKWVSSNAKVITDREGNLIGVEGIARDITELKQSDTDIQALVESTVGTTGKDFFKKIVDSLCRWLDCECAMIGEIIHGNMVRTIAMKKDGQYFEDFRYDLAGTPCENTIEKDFCVYEEGVSELFPEDRVLKSMNASGYIGVPLINSHDGKLIGILCAVSSKKLVFPRRASEVLKIIAARVSAEIKWKKSDEELKKSEDKYRGLVENINETVYRTDNTGRLTYISPNIMTIGGYSQTDVIEKGYIDFVLPEDREGRAEKFLEAMSGKKVISEFRLITKDKKTIWIRTNAAPIMEDGRQVGVQGILSDITDRKEMEETLKKNSERLETIIEYTPVGIVIINPVNHTIVDVNPKAVQMIGMPKDQIIGSVCHNFICPSEEGKCPITDLKQTIDDSERKLLAADARIIPVHKTVLNINMDGRDLLMECIVDVSERKRTEEERLKREKLQAVVETAGAVCHELNQPLQTILGNSELLALSNKDENQNFERIDIIKSQVARMGEITKKLMNITRYETMRYLDKEIIDIEKSTD